MNTFIAFIDVGDHCGKHEFAAHPEFQVESVDNGHPYSVRFLGSRLGVITIRALLEWVVISGLDRNARIIWAFSSVVMPVCDISAVLARWDETGEPPLLSIIALDIGDDRHVSRGLVAFTGFEVAVSFSEPDRSRNAARNLVRLARHAMETGDLARNVEYDGADGHPLKLIWHDRSGALTMITIVF